MDVSADDLSCEDFEQTVLNSSQDSEHAPATVRGEFFSFMIWVTMLVRFFSND